jgi:hypothetical protein
MQLCFDLDTSFTSMRFYRRALVHSLQREEEQAANQKAKAAQQELISSIEEARAALCPSASTAATLSGTLDRATELSPTSVLRTAALRRRATALYAQEKLHNALGSVPLNPDDPEQASGAHTVLSCWFACVCKGLRGNDSAYE